MVVSGRNPQFRPPKGPIYASQYRLRLIAAELIESSSHGYVDFALPYLREYLRDEAAADI